MSETDYRFDGLDEWEQRLTQMIESQYPEEFRKMVIEVAIQLQQKVMENTPVDTGHLRNNWNIGEIQKRGTEYYIEVYNNIEYAESVEYGHRQTPGRFVPGIGKRLVKDFVPGKHMMQLSMMEVQKHLPDYLRDWLDDFISTHEL